MQYFIAVQYVLKFFNSAYNLLLKAVKPITINPLQIIICILVLISGVTAGYDSWENAVRASHGCGEYSPILDSSFAMSNATSMLIPTVILLLLVLFSWNRISTKISTIIVTISYSAFVFYIYMGNAIRHYAPCDRKGDESSFGIFIIGIVFLPIVWLLLSAFFEMTKFIYFALIKYKKLS